MPSLIFGDGVEIGITTWWGLPPAVLAPPAVAAITANGDKERAEGLGEGGAVVSLAKYSLWGKGTNWGGAVGPQRSRRL